MLEKEQRIQEYYDALHAMPEVGFEEHRTAAWLAEKVKNAGFTVKTAVGLMFAADTTMILVVEPISPCVSITSSLAMYVPGTA